MAESKKYLEKIYNEIVGTKEKYGVFHKTIFHLHTPESFDYRLLEKWSEEKFKNSKTSELIDICIGMNIFPDSFPIEEFELVDELSAIYEDKKEWLSYIILAKAIYDNDIEIILVTDHNSIGGISKLKRAIEDLRITNKNHEYPEIISGIEISCADKLHVVGIFDDKNSIHQKELDSWLTENLISERDGTFQTSLSVINFFKDIGAFAYIAHINTAEIFDEKKFLSGGYKNTLKNSGCFDYVGIHEISQKSTVLNRLNKNDIKESYFVIDNDSHCIEELSDRYFWIKAGKRNYNTVLEALSDYTVSVAFDIERKTKKYIAGLYIEYTEEGFLSLQNGKEPFVMRFSDALNCFIGGRGTGKSTVLQILDYSLGLRVDNERILDFLCCHGNVWILFVDGEEQYLIEMEMPKKCEGEDNILQRFGQNLDNRFSYKYTFNPYDIEDVAYRNYLKIYKILDKDGELTFKKVSSKKEVLYKLYDTRYSVNKLVQTASSTDINHFIYNLMFQDKTLSNPSSVIKARSKSGLKKMLRDVKSVKQKRQEEVLEILKPFNLKEEGLLRIDYLQNDSVMEPQIEEWLIGHKASKKKKYMNFNITEENAVEYLMYVYNQVGIYELIAMAVDDLRKKDNHKFDIKVFLIDPNVKDDEANNVIDFLFDNLVRTDNVDKILTYFKTIVVQMEEFSLMFNVNSHVGTNRKVKFVNVLDLSLGQKVVAMLDFILGYGTYIGDYRPLLIDQPEDNLDSQYIYKNLVRQLRDVKKDRQIIIATHNATIVTNAMTDQVCVMNSDGEHGWIERVGYPSEEKIKNSILNYLEGGKDSFKHKMHIYGSVLK